VSFIATTLARFVPKRLLDWHAPSYYSPHMICPHCQSAIPDRLLAKHLAAKGGSAARGDAKREAGRKGGQRTQANARAAQNGTLDCKTSLQNEPGQVSGATPCEASACHDQANVAA
jgi:hypothetical protein